MTLLLKGSAILHLTQPGYPAPAAIPTNSTGATFATTTVDLSMLVNVVVHADGQHRQFDEDDQTAQDYRVHIKMYTRPPSGCV